MPSSDNDVELPVVSPVLFVTVEGYPMCFFLRPGPFKRKLQRSITAGGGVMCNFQKPGAILLIDPEDKSSVPESDAHRYVSAQYILDCVEKDEQLDLEDYRLTSEVFRRQSVHLNSNDKKSPLFTGGRTAYTPEEDAAILQFVSKRKAETNGNRIWQEMQKQNLTGHSWQSMKYHYKFKLSRRNTEDDDTETTGQENDTETMVKRNQERDVDKTSSEEDTDHSKTHSDLTQIDNLGISAESTEGNKEMSEEEEEQHMDQQTEKNQQAETTETKTSDSIQTEESDADMDTDTQIIAAQTTEPKGNQSLTEAGSPQTQSLLEGSPVKPDWGVSQSAKKSKKTTETELPQRRVTRRQLESSSPLEPGSKRLRSSPRPTGKSVPPKDKTPKETPPEKARGGIRKEAESVQERCEVAPVAETPASDQSHSTPLKEGKKKEKKKLGFLELAAKEFEDDSESGEDEASDIQNPSRTAAISSETGPPPSDAAAKPASPQTNNNEPKPRPEPDVQEKEAEPQASQPGSVCPNAATTSPTSMRPATSRAHFFIFESESQQDQSQPAAATGRDAPSNGRPAVDAAAPSLTQANLEDDVQRIRELMSQTNKDLVSVTKALLKTSGDFAAALNLLLNPFSLYQQCWNVTDDCYLHSTNPADQRYLEVKYGKEEVAKRIVFLEV